MVHQDIVIGPALAEVVRAYAGRPLHVVVLCPSAAAVEARESARAKVGYGATSVTDFDRALREDTPHIGLWVDSSAQSPHETADHILANLAAASV